MGFRDLQEKAESETRELLLQVLDIFLPKEERRKGEIIGFVIFCF